MSKIYINIAIEDDLSDAVIRKILTQSESSFEIANSYTRGGFGYLKKHINSFNNAAKTTPFLVLTDLDTAECPPALIKEWLPYPKHPNLIFRVAVREVEAWLLADNAGFAKYIGIQKDKVPHDVEAIADPKQTLVNLTRKSRNKKLREAIVPRTGNQAKQGPDYNGSLIPLGTNHWNIKEAMKNSLSLKKAVDAIKRLKPTF